MPAPHALVAASDKFSTLRGLYSAAGSSGGGSENNLAFKCTRKRLVFETLHLDLEGGVGERRTTPAATSEAVISAVNKSVGVASVKVELEAGAEDKLAGDGKATEPVVKVKRKVAFQSERPELYDF